MSKISGTPHGIFDALTTTGLVDNYGVRQKDPKRVMAALRVQARRRKAIREAKEALAAPIAPPRRRPRPGFKPVGTRQYDRVVRLMLPGEWYSRADLTRAAGFDPNSRGGLMRGLLTNALAKRARNPEAYSGTPTCPAPLWLYCLTPKGEALREIFQLLS